MTTEPEDMSYRDRFVRAAEQCRDAAEKCRDAAYRAETLRMSIRNLGGLHARPLLLTDPGIPVPASHIESLNQLMFTLHGQASIWDSEAQYYEEATPDAKAAD